MPANEAAARPGAVADEIHAARYGCDGRFRQLQLEAGEEGNDLLAASDRLVAADAEQNEVIDVAAVVPDFQREAVLFVLRKVIQMNVHQLGGLDKFAIQFGFGMLSHGL